MCMLMLFLFEELSCHGSQSNWSLCLHCNTYYAFLSWRVKTVNDIICDSPKYVRCKRVGFHKWIVSLCHTERTNVSSWLYGTTGVWEILPGIMGLCEKSDAMLEYTMVLILFFCFFSSFEWQYELPYSVPKTPREDLLQRPCGISQWKQITWDK